MTMSKHENEMESLNEKTMDGSNVFLLPPMQHLKNFSSMSLHSF